MRAAILDCRLAVGSGKDERSIGGIAGEHERIRNQPSVLRAAPCPRKSVVAAENGTAVSYDCHNVEELTARCSQAPTVRCSKARHLVLQGTLAVVGTAQEEPSHLQLSGGFRDGTGSTLPTQRH